MTEASDTDSVETVTMTSSKVGGGAQNIPISITALSQGQLTVTRIAGGPDLIKQVPNMTFTKTNFSAYGIQLRGIGARAMIRLSPLRLTTYRSSAMPRFRFTLRVRQRETIGRA